VELQTNTLILSHLFLHNDPSMKRSYTDILFCLGRPLSPLYSFAMTLRQKAYERGIFKRNRVGCPVISVGNLCLGGTGKTPHVIAMSRYLLKQGFRPAIISRGYGGKAGKGPLIISDGRQVFVDATVCGDEPFMMALSVKGVPVIVGSNRYRSSLAAISSFGCDVIILDDAFQHLSLYRDVDLVLLPAASPLGNGRVFPGGDLRETPKALKRASAIILSKCEQVPFGRIELVKEQIQAITGQIPVFFSDTVFSGLWTDDGKDLLLQSSLPSRVYCFCGIADPDSFIHLIEKAGSEVVGCSIFRDHYPYKQRDLVQLFEKANKLGAEMVITTEKDFVKIKERFNRDFKHKSGVLPLGILHITSRPQPSFWRFLDTKLK